MLQCNAVLLTLIGYLAASCMGEISKFTPYTYVGCYAKDDLSGKLTSDKGIDTFQSQGNCWYNCDGSAIQALIGGNRCYCAGDAKILNGLQQAPDSACSEKCLGYSEKCGGSKYFSVLVNNKNVNDLDFEPLGGGSYTTESSSSSSSGSSSRSSSTSTTSPTDSTTTNEPSSTATSTTQPTTTSTTIVSSKSQDTVSKDSTTTSVQVSTAVVTQSTSIYTTKHDQSMVVITSTFVVTSRPPVTTSSAPSSDTSAMSSSLRDANTSKKSNGISKGAIAGIVVGACSAVLLIVLFVLLWRRKQGGDDVSSRFDENQIYHQAYSFGHNEDIPGGATMPQAAASNGYQNGLGSRPPYPGQHSGHNYGRPRLSNHSLPDITENQALRIANPDSI